MIVLTEKRKRGAPKGNQNAKGNKGGAPFGNTNAVKHGLFMDLNYRMHMEQALKEIEQADELHLLTKEQLRAMTDKAKGR